MWNHYHRGEIITNSREKTCQALWNNCIQCCNAHCSHENSKKRKRKKTWISETEYTSMTFSNVTKVHRTLLFKSQERFLEGWFESVRVLYNFIQARDQMGYLNRGSCFHTSEVKTFFLAQSEEFFTVNFLWREERDKVTGPYSNIMPSISRSSALFRIGPDF